MSVSVPLAETPQGSPQHAECRHQRWDEQRERGWQRQRRGGGRAALGAEAGEDGGGGCHTLLYQVHQTVAWAMRDVEFSRTPYYAVPHDSIRDIDSLVPRRLYTWPGAEAGILIMWCS